VEAQRYGRLAQATEILTQFIIFLHCGRGSMHYAFNFYIELLS
jgi:hypothetical protein